MIDCRRQEPLARIYEWAGPALAFGAGAPLDVGQIWVLMSIDFPEPLCYRSAFNASTRAF
jgi:hypothetical protein